MTLLKYFFRQPDQIALISNIRLTFETASLLTSFRLFMTVPNGDGSVTCYTRFLCARFKCTDSVENCILHFIHPVCPCEYSSRSEKIKRTAIKSGIYRSRYGVIYGTWWDQSVCDHTHTWGLNDQWTSN